MVLVVKKFARAAQVRQFQTPFHILPLSSSLPFASLSSPTATPLVPASLHSPILLQWSAPRISFLQLICFSRTSLFQFIVLDDSIALGLKRFLSSRAQILVGLLHRLLSFWPWKRRRCKGILRLLGSLAPLAICIWPQTTALFFLKCRRGGCAVPSVSSYTPASGMGWQP
jgi:hypothetical protein